MARLPKKPNEPHYFYRASTTKEVYRLIESSHAGLTSTEIAKELGETVHAISGRITDLAKSKRIFNHGKKYNPETRRSNRIWRCTKWLNESMKQ